MPMMTDKIDVSGNYPDNIAKLVKSARVLLYSGTCGIIKCAECPASMVYHNRPNCVAKEVFSNNITDEGLAWFRKFIQVYDTAESDV